MVISFSQEYLTELQEEFPGLSDDVRRTLMPSMIGAMRELRPGDKWNDADFEFWLKRIYTPAVTKTIEDLKK